MVFQGLFWTCQIALLLCLIVSQVGKVGSFSIDSPITYSPSILRALRPPCLNSCQQHQTYNFPQQKHRRRGRKGGVREKNRRRKARPFLPTAVFGNTQSLNNKMDELQACCEHMYEYRDTSILGFCETWFNEAVNEQNSTVDGFRVYRGDRTSAAGKIRGGGVCLYVNERWANKNNTHVKETMCTQNIELLTVLIRPYYLPREFTSVIVNVVYVPPKASSTDVTDILTSRIHDQETHHPDAVKLIMGDFNQFRLDQALPHYDQYVTCTTRNDITIEPCYGNVKNAYKSVLLPPLGSSDHNNVYLVPKYRPLLKSKKPTTKTVTTWSDDSADQLRGCFDATDWTVFEEACTDIDELTDTVSGYINFCENIVCVEKTITNYPNSKPWVTRDLRELIKERKCVFRLKDHEKSKAVSRAIKNKINECKNDYKRKLEENFKTNNTKKMWQALKTMTGYSAARETVRVENERDYANELNEFYSRFDCFDFQKEHTGMRERMRRMQNECDEIFEEEVLLKFKRINVNKSGGPDHMSGRLIKECCDQLSPIFTYIFNLSLRTQTIPKIWKTAMIVPVPKKPKIATMNDLRPVALTSIVFKSFERIILTRIQAEIKPVLDPFQFAYKEKRNVEDAILILLNTIFRHLETPKAYVRTLFIDFSSAFNTIQPHLLVEKLLNLGVSVNTTLWVLDFLTNRLQFVKLNNAVSNIRITHTGGPQGCVLSPILYTIYTNDYRSHHSDTRLIKFADDSSILGIMSTEDERNYFDEINNFISWCDTNFLTVNVKKTKEIIFDFRRAPTSISPLFIKGEQVETTTSYKYLGITIDRHLSFQEHIDGVYKKINQRLFFLRKLRSFNVSVTIMRMFYTSTIESLILFGINCYGGSLNAGQKSKISKII